MTPLDLSTRPPRRVREQLAGICYLPRAIDKVRAQLPGGNLGPYVVLAEGIRTLSSGMYYFFGFSHDEFADLVASAGDDGEIAAWVLERAPGDKIAKWNAGLLNRRIGDIDGPTRERMIANHRIAATLPDDTLLVDMFDADDAATYASVR